MTRPRRAGAPRDDRVVLSLRLSTLAIRIARAPIAQPPQRSRSARAARSGRSLALPPAPSHDKFFVVDVFVAHVFVIHSFVVTLNV
jgi:hypothetical protein